MKTRGLTLNTNYAWFHGLTQSQNELNSRFRQLLMWAPLACLWHDGTRQQGWYTSGTLRKQFPNLTVQFILSLSTLTDVDLWLPTYPPSALAASGCARRARRCRGCPSPWSPRSPSPPSRSRQQGLLLRTYISDARKILATLTVLLLTCKIVYRVTHVVG